MNKIQAVIKALDGIHNGQEAAVQSTIKENEQALLDLNKQQLFKGEDSRGQSLGRYKSKKYAAFKSMLNPNNVVDLFLTGLFYAKFYIKRYLFPIEISSRDSKTSMLIKRRGKFIFGLNQESKGIYSQRVVREGLLKFWKKSLRL